MFISCSVDLLTMFLRGFYLFHFLFPFFILQLTGTSNHISCAPAFIHWKLYSYLMCTCFHSLEPLFISHMHLFLFIGNSIHISCAPVFILWKLFISHVHLYSFTGNSIYISGAPVFTHWKLYSYLMCTYFHSRKLYS